MLCRACLVLPGGAQVEECPWQIVKFSWKSRFLTNWQKNLNTNATWVKPVLFVISFGFMGHYLECFTFVPLNFTVYDPGCSQVVFLYKLTKSKHKFQNFPLNLKCSISACLELNCKNISQSLTVGHEWRFIMCIWVMGNLIVHRLWMYKNQRKIWT